MVRGLTCHVIILNLLVWPAPGQPLKPVLESGSAFLISSIASVIGELQALPVVMLPLDSGHSLIPVPVLRLLPFQTMSVTRSISMAERTARVSAVSISPHRLVAYIGETVTFIAMGTGLDGYPAHGAKFQWESSDTSKLTIDEAGLATMLQPGMVIVSARAGAAIQAAPVLIRPQSGDASRRTTSGGPINRI